jgi:hypothetical protein
MAEYLNKILPKMQLPASITLAIFGFCLFLNAITPLNLPKIIYDTMIIYVAINSIAAPFALTHRFITPKIANPKCPFCGVYMNTVRLKCPSCGKVAGEEK